MPSSTRGRPARAPAGFRVRPLLGALAAAGVIAPTSLHAATIPVTTGGDAGNGATCTLRQAAESLNTAALVASCTNPSAVAFGNNDTVDLTGQSGTIALTAGSVPLLVTMEIVGPGATGLTISGGGTSRVFDAGTNSIGVDLRSLTIANGRSAGPGGCIFGGQSGIELIDAVVTGCTATHDPGGPYLNGLGGGIFAYEVALQNSTVSGNTAQTAGGGVFALYVFGYRSLVAGNTVTGHTCNVDTTPGKYCYSAAFGGGGVFGGSAVNLTDSVVSGNTVNASTFSEADGSLTRLGIGGGITQIGKYGGGGGEDLLASTGKSTVAGTRALFRGSTPATRAAAQARSAQRLAASPAAKARARSKADGQGDYRLGLFATTLSGNRILGGGGAAPEVAKYSGGGAAFYSEYENAEFANSTVSGNTLPNGLPCAVGAPEPPVVFSCGAALAGDSLELTNSTVTGNVGATAVQFKYDSTPALAAGKSTKLAKAAERFPQLAELHTRWRQAQSKAGGKAVAKASSPPIFDSSIVAGNVGTYDVACIENCTISGANNLVRTRQSTVTFVNSPINANPQLAPLANNGGVVAGAPGVVGTGPVRTHALYIGSPAINAGSNIEGFSYDQRGPGFPRQGGPAVDIGAFEGAIAAPAEVPVPALGAAQLALLATMLAASAAFLRRRRRS